MENNTEIKDDNQATKPTVSGHVETVVSCDFDTWAFNQCVKLGNKIEGIKDATGKNIAWVNTTTKEQYFLQVKSN